MQEDPNLEQESNPTSNHITEEYKDSGEYHIQPEPVHVPTKHIPVASYGPRIRIAKLYESYEDFLYTIIKVAGWVKTARQGGKDFTFIEISDGSHMKGI